MEHKTTLSERAETIYKKMLKHPGKWWSRAEIAESLGESRLQGYEVACLDFLREIDKVEGQQRPIDAPIRERWEYRVKK
jgi:hypothetical protein